MNSQVRYNGSVYDILESLILGEHQYLIIGTGNADKFFDIAFIEKKIENEKVRYISPSINYQSNIANENLTYMQSQALMDYVVNKITDEMNNGILSTKEETIERIKSEILKINNNVDIKGFFETERVYNNHFKDDIDILVKLYDNNYKIDMSDESKVSVEEIYDELEKTQNFGVSAIYDYELKKNGSEYISDPTNPIMDENKKETDNFELSSVEEDETLEKEQLPVIEKTLPNFDEPLTVSDIEYLLEKKGETMSLQQKIYWEGEKARIAEKETLPEDSIEKGKVKKLSNGKSILGENAAYIAISLLLYLIGSFELLLSIIMLAK